MSCQGDEFEFHRREIARPLVEPDARKLAADAEALQVSVRPEMNISPEHPGASECDLDRAIHGGGESRRDVVVSNWLENWPVAAKGS
jgi:hypothetical protein